MNTHFETIIPSVFNKVTGVNYSRTRIELEDDDFLDLDWLKNDNERLMIIGHGLEGSTERHYVKRPAKYFHEKGWDILAWNNRGCGGELNRSARGYHHGETKDLHEVIRHAIGQGYQTIFLFGLSMGGCQMVKYLGEYHVDPKIIGAFTVSVSCDLKDTSIAAEKHLGGFYSNRFLSKLKKRVAEKAKHHDMLRDVDLSSIDSFDKYHQQVTCKVFDFKDADEFYESSSCVNYFDSIKTPVFILNALNDPLLGAKCYPLERVKDHAQIYLETPTHGGHVGFTMVGKPYSYIEYRAEKFLEEVILSSSRTSVKPH